jgi:hypothetical protein
VPEADATPRPTRRLHARPERHATKAAPDPAANQDAVESVRRGVLPSGSREAYPDK